MANHGERTGRAQLRARFVSATADRSLEWFSACAMIVWCVTLAAPGDLLTIPTYRAFLRFGLTEAHWTAIFGLVGSARLVALYVNGRWPQGPLIRMVGAFIGVSLWLPIAIMTAQGGLATYSIVLPGAGIHALLAFAELISIRRAAHDTRYYR